MPSHRIVRCIHAAVGRVAVAEHCGLGATGFKLTARLPEAVISIEKAGGADTIIPTPAVDGMNQTMLVADVDARRCGDWQQQ